MGSELRVFGDRARFRRSLATHRTTGHDLVEQAEGARLSMEQAGENRLISYVAEEEWTGRVEGWRGRVHRLLRQYLGPTAQEALPHTTADWPPDTGKPRHARHIGWVLEWLEMSLKEIDAFVDDLTPAQASGHARPASSTQSSPVGKQYDVALSFAGEQRDYVEAVAESLRADGVMVFYDRFEEVDLWGRNLYDHLAAVYGKQSRYVVMFASTDYAAKAWTNHERIHTQARAIEESRAFLLPVRFDATEIPGLASTMGYLDATRLEPEELAERIKEKINDREAGLPSDDAEG